MLALNRVVGKGRPFGLLTDPGSFWGRGEGGKHVNRSGEDRIITLT